jgi:Fic family protein
MVEHIYQSNRIEGISDDREIEQSLTAWRWLMAQPDLTHDVVREVQRVVVANQVELKPAERGAYRDVSQVNVVVGGYRPPHWQDVPALMDAWLAGLGSRTPWLNHVEFEGVHPFVDGNGRTGRMLLWREQILGGFEPMLILGDHRLAYFRDLEWHRKVLAAGEAVASGWSSGV